MAQAHAHRASAYFVMYDFIVSGSFKQTQAEMPVGQVCGIGAVPTYVIDNKRINTQIA